MNVLELYSVDADLAYDPNFCYLSGSMCGSGSYNSVNGLSATQQYNYFNQTGTGTNNGVGIGYTCGGNPQGSLAVGNCEYSYAINNAQGYH